jgi:hypothetical protein
MIGGYKPALTQIFLALTACSKFNRKANTVARPQAVLPIISVWLSLNSKCSLQACCRGLKAVF